MLTPAIRAILLPYMSSTGGLPSQDARPSLRYKDPAKRKTDARTNAPPGNRLIGMNAK
jgi:hypothetical protein